jgi:nucleoside-diphosphate-sugar epimerase
LRRSPVFGIFGDGLYKLQPIHVDDFAKLAVEQGKECDNRVIDGIGPETFTYRGLVETVSEIIGRRRPVVSVSPAIGHAVASAIGRVVGDVVLTREEIAGLMSNLLYVTSPPAGTTRLTDWAREHASSLGKRYASELARRKDRERAYGDM